MSHTSYWHTPTQGRISRGGGGFFSRGVGGFSKIVENFDDLFLSDQIDFSSSPKALKRRFWALFENVDKKIAFFGARSSSKNSIFYGLKKNFTVGRPKMDFLKTSKGGPFGSAGGRIPEEGGGVRPPPPHP